MLKKIITVFLLIGAAVSASIGTTIMLTDIMKKKQKEEKLESDMAYSYERQLSEDAQLQEEVERFTSKENIKTLYLEHEDELERLVEECYRNREQQKKEISSTYGIKYIDGVMFYCYGGDWIKPAEDKNYESVIKFMDYAIENGLVFRDWMLKVGPPNPPLHDECYKRQGRGMTFSVKEIDHMVFYLTDYPQLKAVQSGEYDYVTSFMNYAIENNLPYFYSDFEIRTPFLHGEYKQGGGEADNWDELLKITLYKSKGLEASLIYSLHENMDDAGGIHVEEEGIDRYEKTVRINPNWYYLYIVTKIPGYWSPEIKISEQNK